MLGYFRLLAAAGVAIAHAGNLVTPATSRAMVSAFFVVSGFLIALTITEKYSRRPLAFYRNRFLRLYPMYWVIALTVIATMPAIFLRNMGAFPESERLEQFVRAMALMFLSSEYIVGPAWTLPYEITFYLLAPLVMAFTFRRFPIGVLIFGAVGLLAFSGIDNLVLLANPFMIGYARNSALYAAFVMFAFGSLLYFISRNYKLGSSASRWMQGSGIALLAVVIAMGSRFVSGNDVDDFDLLHAPAIGLTAYAAAALVLLGWTPGETASSKLAGDLTYPVYLVHWPLLNAPFLLWQPLREHLQWWAHLFTYGDLVVMAAFGLVGSAAISYVLVLLDRRFVAPLRAENVERRERPTAQASGTALS